MSMDRADRIEALREEILATETIHRQQPELLWARSWQASAGEPWHIIRRGQATADILRGLSPEIGPHDLLVGRFASTPLSDEEQEELRAWQEGPGRVLPQAYGQRSHMAIDYETLLRLGLRGVRQRIEGYRSRLDPTRGQDLERDAFYRACLVALDGLGDLALRYADHAESLADAANTPERRKELYEVARICRRVPEQPAETFHEALQAVHLVTFALCAGQMMLLFQLGRPDRYLLPYYQRDLAAGRLTVEKAQELIDHLCLMLNTYTPRGLAVGFMVGGRDGAGNDMSNPLTQHFIESIAHTRLSYPGIGLCWNEDTPEEITERACELLSEGLTHPALFNDEVITRGMSAAGLPPQEACLYTHSTCVEISPIASSNVYVASPYVNLLQLLHDLLGVPPLESYRAYDNKAPISGGAMPSDLCGDAAQWTNFQALLDAYQAHLADTIEQAVIAENTCQATRYYHGGWPLLSCFVNDCLAQGRDIDQGGARHNWIEPSFVGLANVIDSLVAIRRLVFEEQRLTLPELVAQMRGDFRDERTRRMLDAVPKYGNDDDSLDELAVTLTETILAECSRYRTYLGGAFHPGFFCWVMHERLGALTAASADGRHAGAALGDGSGPAQGRERLGPTAAILSATKWRHAPMLGGIAVNLKFTPAGDRDTFVQSLADIVRTFMRRGGFELQVNVVDTEVLRAARAHPEAYRDLVVRIGGYSDYFVGLSPRMQEEIIARTEHGL